MRYPTDVRDYGIWYTPATLPVDTYREPIAPPLLENIATAVNAEYNAILAYEALARLAPNQDFRTIITKIRDDEMGHFRNFSQIYALLTHGQHPTLSAKALPTVFIEGVEESLRDELEDSKFYQETAMLTTDSRLHLILQNASADEARHATWFSYIWNSSR